MAKKRSTKPAANPPAKKAAAVAKSTRASTKTASSTQTTAAKPKAAAAKKAKSRTSSKSSSTTNRKRKSTASSPPSTTHASEPKPPSPSSATSPTSTSKPPEWLLAKPIACTKWRELLGELETRGLVVTIDLGLFALYCEAWQAYSDAELEVKKEGLYFETEKGYVGIHPAELVKDKAIKRIMSLGDRLGLGINSRRGLELEGPGDQEGGGDPLLAYARKKKP